MKRTIDEIVLTSLPEEKRQAVSDLKTLLPLECNFSRIQALMAETFSARRALVLKGSPVLEIFKEYPRIIDYHGRLISEDFKQLNICLGDISNLEKYNFTYSEKVQQYITDDILKRLATLVQDLPNRQVKRMDYQIVDNVADWEEKTFLMQLSPLVQWIKVKEIIE